MAAPTVCTESKSVICLFDVDGTLTEHRQKISTDMHLFLKDLRKKCHVGLVSGSDMSKIHEQMSTATQHVTEQFEYVFTENGLVAHQNGIEIHRQDIAKYLGEEKSQKLINFILKTLSEITLPCKRGNFVEFRSGMLNISPIGRSCSQSEREQFAAFDKKNDFRLKLVDQFRKEFEGSGLQFIVGGQISMDIFPEGWDKRYCLKHIEDQKYDKIYFFGDRTNPGGNDYEIFHDPRTIGITVTNPQDTRLKVEQLGL